MSAICENRRSTAVFGHTRAALATPIAEPMSKNILLRSVAVTTLTFTLLGAMTGCAKAEPPSSAATSAPAAVMAGESTGGQAASLVPAARRARIVTVDMALTVDKVDAAEAELRREVERVGGWVASGNTSGDDEGRRASLDVRVPAERLAAFRESARRLGQATSDSEKVEDVTEQRADVSARLRAARAQEKRVIELMSGKTSTLHEVIEAERELARVRENIERLEAQERNLEGNIAMATVRISISAHATQAWQTPGASITRAGRAGVKGALAAGVYAAMVLATVLPTVLPVAAVLAAIAFAVRRRKKAQAAALAG